MERVKCKVGNEAELSIHSKARGFAARDGGEKEVLHWAFAACLKCWNRVKGWERSSPTDARALYNILRHQIRTRLREDGAAAGHVGKENLLRGIAESNYHAKIKLAAINRLVTNDVDAIIGAHSASKSAAPPIITSPVRFS